MAEYYSADLSQKVKRGMTENLLKGYFNGGSIPYGYKVKDKKLIINDDEAIIIKKSLIYIQSNYIQLVK